VTVEREDRRRLRQPHYHNPDRFHLRKSSESFVLVDAQFYHVDRDEGHGRVAPREGRVERREVSTELRPREEQHESRRNDVGIGRASSPPASRTTRLLLQLGARRPTEAARAAVAASTGSNEVGERAGVSVGDQQTTLHFDDVTVDRPRRPPTRKDRLRVRSNVLEVGQGRASPEEGHR